LIKTIDEDLGLSGTSSYQRSGFQQLLQLLDRDEVGLVLVHDVSRLSRNPHAAEEFLMRAVRGRILIEANGHLFEAGDRNLPELFGFRIKSLLAWWGNAFNVESFRRAKEAKVPQGFAVTRPPVGYVKSGHGQWELDPDVAVQEAIRRVFDLYPKLRSIRRVARDFEAHAR
jgi:DNA invertase Pin-like site-specific DNA recombinase